MLRQALLLCKLTEMLCGHVTYVLVKVRSFMAHLSRRLSPGRAPACWRPVPALPWALQPVEEQGKATAWWLSGTGDSSGADEAGHSRWPTAISPPRHTWRLGTSPTKVSHCRRAEWQQRCPFPASTTPTQGRADHPSSPSHLRCCRAGDSTHRTGTEGWQRGERQPRGTQDQY